MVSGRSVEVEDNAEWYERRGADEVRGRAVGSARDNCGCSAGAIMMGDRASTPMVPTFVRALRGGFLTFRVSANIVSYSQTKNMSL